MTEAGRSLAKVLMICLLIVGTAAFLNPGRRVISQELPFGHHLENFLPRGTGPVILNLLFFVAR